MQQRVGVWYWRLEISVCTVFILQNKWQKEEKNYFLEEVWHILRWSSHLSWCSGPCNLSAHSLCVNKCNFALVYMARSHMLSLVQWMKTVHGQASRALLRMTLRCAAKGEGQIVPWFGAHCIRSNVFYAIIYFNLFILIVYCRRLDACLPWREDGKMGLDTMGSTRLR